MTSLQPDDLARRYIRLAHHLDAHSPSFIDGYGGPAELADRTLRPVAEVKAELEALQDDVQNEPDATRRTFLEAQTRAMHTLARILGGEKLPYEKEVRGLYGIDPVRADLSELDAALRELDAALPGTGRLSEREEAVRARVTVEPENLLRVAEPIVTELRRRTQQQLGLPDGENFSIGLVNNQPWGGYNWPLGNLQSRIDINTDLAVALTSLPDLMAHEGYPGHHTEHATKEAELVRGRGWFEHSIQLINAPECVVSEGIAMNALTAVMSEQEVGEWLTGELASVAGLEPEAVQAALHLARLKEKFSSVSGHAAMMLHQDGASQREVLDFFQHYGATEERAQKSFDFIAQPTFRAYIFTYSVGSGLVRQAVERGAVTFRELLREPKTPSDLRV
ncbi:DUF885 domain-containing protein [Deinococcus detaillensis]|uniref:DUF885 domain-containing protein n=1 Tax=Deinococcus detaillensis TaxID=2592048 RepID=A0A553UU32_9DEIO|nr:DUF885 domain-containing protein [Deinococcus detaillensis]TSA83712.1 DUF885 domain-containing protein [Deinococcus detaillensis]